MKNHPVHQNLDTSFVNLSALIKYLRRRAFSGNIRVELGDYEADIVLRGDAEIKAREHDRLAGRIAEGEDVLQRLLIRAREPGGIINVYRASDVEQTSAAEKTDFAANENQNYQETLDDSKFIAPDEQLPPPKNNQSLFSFELSNHVKAKARQTEMTSEEWRALLDLTGELLETIEMSLAEANLVFTSAFEKARFEISTDYPFLSPVSGIFSYKDGNISMEEQINAAVFVAGVNEALRRILDKLGKNPKFVNVYRTTTQQILALIYRQKTLYDKFSITPQLEKNIGA